MESGTSVPVCTLLGRRLDAPTGIDPASCADHSTTRYRHHLDCYRAPLRSGPARPAALPRSTASRPPPPTPRAQVGDRGGGPPSPSATMFIQT